MGGTVEPVRFLLIAKQKKNVDTFETTIDELLRRGHEVTLAIQERDVERDRRLQERFASTRFLLAACPEARGDAWRSVAPLLRSARDWAHYYQPAFASATKLHQRALVRLLRELGSSSPLDVGRLSLPTTSGARLRHTLAHIESSIPSDPLHEEFILRHAPDVVLVTPGLHFGSGQSDFVKSARARGVPVWLLLFSWDNLSTKGALHVAPDRLFVWNARQVREAEELHGYPPDRVTVVGAPRFDEFFTLRTVVSRARFFAPLQLDTARPTILYLCSSRFIAADEPSFIRTWLTMIRESGAEELRRCNVIVRPHPDVAFEPVGRNSETVTWDELPQAMGWVHRPFGDAQAVVLRTTYGTPQAFYECLHHADVVVALNTSAELEAGIVGRPVLTVLASGAAADGQAHTLHFNYLLQEQGGFVRYSPDLSTHERHLLDVLSAPRADDRIRAFVLEFLRPRGNSAVAPLLADALTETLAPRDPDTLAARAKATPDDGVAPAASLDTSDLAAPGVATAKALQVQGSAGLVVLASPETRPHRHRGTLRLNPVEAQWLEEVVGPGDVLYDIGAGIGAYALVAALTRGALTIAFEPGFGVYQTLCENIRLNSAGHGVLPLPVALGDRTGLFELEYAGAAGSDRHVLRNQEWRARRETDDRRVGQPVCADRLSDIVERYRLPHPHTIRLRTSRQPERILSGAQSLIERPGLRSVLVTSSRPLEIQPAHDFLHVRGFAATALPESEEFGHAIRFDRHAAPSSGLWHRLRKMARRNR